MGKPASQLNMRNQWIVLFQIKSATTDTQTLVWGPDRFTNKKYA